MNFNGLQLRRALSVALFVLLLSVAGMKNAFAQNQVAVLQHNDTITAFYGADAFKQANAAAADGDTITLSSGNFNGNCYINKAITLHGAGMVSDTLGVTRTQINGLVYLNVSNVVDYLAMEGVYFGGNVYVFNESLLHAIFHKCYFAHFNATNYGGNLHDVAFYNCLIANCSVCSAADAVAFYNCVLNSFYNPAVGSSSSVFAYNSIIMPTNQDHSCLNLYNCIIGGNVSHIQSQYADHCILIGESFPSTVAAYDCMNVTSYDEVFETWDGTFTIDADYSLKAEIANTFLGNDGTQVGLFGGFMPFHPRPNYLRPYRCIVPGYTTTDGHLNIEVEVAP